MEAKVLVSVEDAGEESRGAREEGELAKVAVGGCHFEFAVLNDDGSTRVEQGDSRIYGRMEFIA